MLKYIIFWLSATFGITGGVFTCTYFRNGPYFMLFLMILVTGFHKEFSINFVSQENYRAITRGFEITLIDLLAIVLLIHIFLSGQKKIYWTPPTTFLTAIFFLIAIAGWLLAPESLSNPQSVLQGSTGEGSEMAYYPVFRTSLYPLFEIFKIVRAYLVYWVICNLSDKEKAIKWAMVAMGILILLFTEKSLFIRYVEKVNRVSAGIGQVNDYMAYMGILGAFFIPFVFQTPSKKYTLLYFGLVVGAAVAIILGISRAILLGYGAAILLNMLFYLFFKPNPKTLLLVLLISLTGTLMVTKAAKTLSERFFVSEPTSISLEGRKRINEPASDMANSNVFGVGMGNVAAFLTTRYGIYGDSYFAGTIFHNIWDITKAETGYPGLIVFTLVNLRLLQIMLRNIWDKNVRCLGFYFAANMGVLSAFTVIHLVSIFHYSFRYTPIYFLLQILFGLAVGIYLEKKNLKQVAKF